jgi:hypothetical protein
VRVAAGGGLGGVAVVLELRPAGEVHRADLTGRELLAVLADDVELAEHGAADGALMPLPVRGREPGHAGPLGRE